MARKKHSLKLIGLWVWYDEGIFSPAYLHFAVLSISSKTNMYDFNNHRNSVDSKQYSDHRWLFRPLEAPSRSSVNNTWTSSREKRQVRKHSGNSSCCMNRRDWGELALIQNWKTGKTKQGRIFHAEIWEVSLQSFMPFSWVIAATQAPQRPETCCGGHQPTALCSPPNPIRRVQAPVRPGT